MGRFTFNPPNPTDDTFNLAPVDQQDPIPEEQQSVQTEVYEARNILQFLRRRGAFSNDQHSYNQFIQRLIQAATVGCVQQNVQTGSAKNALNAIRNDVMREFGRIIFHRYLLAFAGWSMLGFGIGAALVLFSNYQDVPSLVGYGWAIVGAMAGAWMSVAILQKQLSFEGVQDFVDRRYEPIIRVFSATATTVVIAVFLQLKIVSIQLGPVDLGSFTSTMLIAIVLGFMSGFFGDRLLSGTLERMASALPK
jgi:hypothetical protein